MFCLIGALRPENGAVEVFGKDPNGRDPEVKKRIGFTPEQPAFYNHLSIFQNLVFAGRMLSQKTETTKDRIGELSKGFGFEEYVRRKPSTLSQGYRQRISIAEALIGNPDLLILDEPTTGLDPASMIRIRDELLRMNKDMGMTILISSHNLHLLERAADYYIFLRKGRVAALGTIEELSEKFGHEHSTTIETEGLSPEVLEKLRKEFANGVQCEEGLVRVSGDPQSLTRVLGFLVSNGVIVKNAEKHRDALEAIYMSAVGESDTAGDISSRSPLET
jgi:ABC-type multidrug transport system ATPase subunit